MTSFWNSPFRLSRLLISYSATSRGTQTENESIVEYRTLLELDYTFNGDDDDD